MLCDIVDWLTPVLDPGMCEERMRLDAQAKLNEHARSTEQIVQNQGLLKALRAARVNCASRGDHSLKVRHRTGVNKRGWRTHQLSSVVNPTKDKGEPSGFQGKFHYKKHDAALKHRWASPVT
jgi:hypothetical protein